MLPLPMNPIVFFMNKHSFWMMSKFV